MPEPRHILVKDYPYKPHLARIIRIRPLVEDTNFYQIRFEDEKLANKFEHLPGQFVEMSVLGAGEFPVSISSSPTRRGILEFCIRRAGRVTEALHKLRENALVGLRGPYGNGFPVERMVGNNLLLIAGGLGVAPIRSLFWYAFDNRHDFKDVIFMHGARSPEEMLFRDEFLSMRNREDLRLLLTVDKDPDKTWPEHIGMVTDLFKYVGLDPATTYAAVCGPPIVYKFVLQELLKRNFSKDRILMSLERRMKCGIGKCGHCIIGYKYTCLHGPIFTYWDAKYLQDLI